MLQFAPIWFLFCLNPFDEIPTRLYDMGVINHVYHSDAHYATNGRINFTQLVVFNFREKEQKFAAEAWCMLPARRELTEEEVKQKKIEWVKLHPKWPVPLFNADYKPTKYPINKDNEWEMTFRPNNTNDLIKVRFLTLSEIHTAYDIELLNRELFPTEQRIGWPKPIKRPVFTKDLPEVSFPIIKIP